MTPAVQFLGVGKRFGSIVACEDVTFDVHAGEVHAIVGENGAGKSTLMKLLSGFLRADEGEIRVGGRPLRPTPRHARSAGIGLCAQHFHQVPTLTGLENILLGSTPRPWLRPVPRDGEARVRVLMERYGLRTELDRPVQELSVGEQERIEISSLLHRNAQILILDEPTAVLAPTEIESLFGVLRELASEGRSILFVTHKLPEVMEIADRVTVLRRGRVVDSMVRDAHRREEENAPASSAHRPPHRAHETDLATKTEPFDSSRLVAAIVGGERPAEVSWTARVPGELLLETRDLSAGGARSGIRAVSVRLHEGEIFGIGGVEGNGQAPLVRAILGHLEPEQGTISYRGVPRSAAQLRSMRSHLAVIPEDRGGEGLMLRRDLADNAVLGLHQRPPFSRRGWLDRTAVRTHAARLVSDYQVQPPDLDRSAGTLSGGNQQRLLVGRELWRDPDLLIAVHPTRGVDLAATRFIHAKLLAARARGQAVLLVSADLNELFALSDRVAILYRGQIEYEADRAELEIGRAHRALLGLERSGSGP